MTPEEIQASADAGHVATHSVTDSVTTVPVETVTEPLAGPEQTPAEDQEPVRGTIAEWAITILLLLFLTATLVQAFVIPTGSMEDTLLVGDHLLVDKLTYAPSGPISKHLLPYRAVKRGDIIVFRYPVDISQTFVKRCMGVPGDHIRVVNKQVYLNGHLLDEPYVVHKTDYLDSYRDNFPGEPNANLFPGAIDMLQHHVLNGEVVVPNGYYFAMGDNRDHSADSRYWGFVDHDAIMGRPFLIYWSVDASSADYTPNTFFERLKGIFDTLAHLPTRTRWNRMLHTVH